jgi:UPF0755 protein
MDNEDFDIKQYEKYFGKEEDGTQEQKKPASPVEYEEISSFSEKNKKFNKTPFIIIIVILAAAIVVAGVFLAKAFKSRIGDFKDDMPTVVNTTVSTVRVTFPEGFTVYQMGQRLEENGVCSAADFYAAANAPFEGIETPDRGERVYLLEGYLFPDTYDFYKNESAQNVVAKFVNNYKNKVTPEMQAKAQTLGYTMDEMLTLASIIQKECDMDIDECKNVSSVFHNRLSISKDTYLGSDVTYFYLKNMADFLGGKDSERFDNLLLNYYTYNKYRKGLPAGPICNPGLKAVQAALEPNDTDYQFFLTDKSGENFYYAATYEKHLQNAKEAGLN